MKLSRLLALATLALLPRAAAEANWTASGRFVYVDREWDQTGFTGVEPQLPVRSADIQILDSKNRLLASGATDLNGNFSILVVDSSTRTVYARVLTTSVSTPGLFIEVRDSDGNHFSNYAVRTANVSNHNPNTNYNFGTTVALKGQGGEALNIYDQLLRGVDYIAFLRGSRPGSREPGAVRRPGDRHPVPLSGRHERGLRLHDPVGPERLGGHDRHHPGGG